MCCFDSSSAGVLCSFASGYFVIYGACADIRIMSIPMIQKGLERLETLIAESQAQLKRMEEFMRASRGESNSKFEAMLEDQNAKFANLRTELSAMRSDVNSMKTNTGLRMDTLEKKITNLELSFKTMRTEMTGGKMTD